MQYRARHRLNGYACTVHEPGLPKSCRGAEDRGRARAVILGAAEPLLWDLLGVAVNSQHSLRTTTHRAASCPGEKPYGL